MGSNGPFALVQRTDWEGRRVSREPGRRLCERARWARMGAGPLEEDVVGFLICANRTGG